MNLLNCAAYSLIQLDILSRVEEVFDGIIGVTMRADEVDWDACLFHMCEESVNPICRGGCWSSNPEVATDGL